MHEPRATPDQTQHYSTLPSSRVYVVGGRHSPSVTCVHLQRDCNCIFTLPPFIIVARQLQCGSNGKLGVGSNTTSPDSGASVSPGQGVDGAAVFPRQQPLVPGPGPRANPRTLTHTIHTSDASWTHTQEVVLSFISMYH